MTKWTTEIDEADRVPELVSRAFHTATAGRPGPVVVALPKDMLAETTAAREAAPSAAIETAPAAGDMDRLAQMIAGAQRPLFVLGGSRWSEAATLDIRRFAERFRDARDDELPPLMVV